MNRNYSSLVRQIYWELVGQSEKLPIWLGDYTVRRSVFELC